MSRPTVVTVTAIMLGLVLVTMHAEQRVVSQKGKAFSVDTLTIKPGDELVFKNDDEVTHNVFTIAKGMDFNLKTQAPDTSASHVFTVEGVAEIRCAFHPKMKMTVIVKK